MHGWSYSQNRQAQPRRFRRASFSQVFAGSGSFVAAPVNTTVVQRPTDIARALPERTQVRRVAVERTPQVSKHDEVGGSVSDAAEVM